LKVNKELDVRNGIGKKQAILSNISIIGILRLLCLALLCLLNITPRPSLLGET